ncbi:type IV secretion system DNA-binding domain-containing protein [Actinomadura barringtoniae]|uniref:Type IV secretion system DNA-binding domain-containing protein n=1 Tax=Actinomadura barringtoniae TaxID=1427535 RepID=A0A939PL69_9ACTN|nr:type IV secretion system DNA-binding domain-containing protein [Actinomadura barringtoniae]MBO2454355.1 type IV secretion system DNA-binding domain-containing protein [Actinomadura barringtoniae]
MSHLAHTPTGLLHDAGAWTEVLVHWIDHMVKEPVRLAELATGYGAAFTATALTVAGTRALVWRWRNRRLAEGARLVEIAVPPKVEDASAAAWWARLIGLTAPWWKRLMFGQQHLAWEYLADINGLRVQVWVPGTIPLGLVEKSIRAAWPGATLTTHPSPSPPIPLEAACAGGRLTVARTDHFPLATDHKADPLRGLLGAVAGLGKGEYAAVQILARPVAGRRLARAHKAAAALRGGRSTAPQAAFFDLITPSAGSRSTHTHLGDITRTHPERADQVRAILGKAAGPRFEVQILYAVATTRRVSLNKAQGQATGKADGVGAAEKGWLRGHAHEIASTFASYTSAHQYLRRKRLHAPAEAMAARRLDRGYLLCAEELAALAHLPYDLAAPGVVRAGAAPVAPSPAVPASHLDGAGPVRILGDAEAGPARPVAMPVTGGREHTHMVGQTGVGKSTLLSSMILADAHAGRGALVIDPKGDLIADILDRLPERAIGNTVVFDPLSSDPPPCINVLAGPDPAFAVESIVTTFRRCFSSAWGPRLDDLLRSACLTLTRTQGPTATLGEVPRLLTDSDFRARLIGRLGPDDALLRGFWDTYEDQGPGGRAAMISPVMNKLRAVLLRPFVRQALSGSSSTVDLRRMLDDGGLVLARLPKGVLGEDATRLCGSLLLAHTWQAITPRANVPEAQRRDAAAYVDEAHNFLNLPGSISDILAEARGYRFGLTLAHQHLTQLPADLREALSADARNKLYFAVSPEDADRLAKPLEPLITAHDLSHLGGYQAVGRVMNGSSPTPAFTFRTRPLPEPVPGRAQAVRAASQHHYGAKTGPDVRRFRARDPFSQPGQPGGEVS